MRRTIVVSLVAAAIALSVARGAVAQDAYQVIEPRVGCIEKDEFSKLIGYQIENDKEAFVRAMSMGLLNGTMTQFEVGDVVYLSDTSFTGLVKLRRKGETTEYWTAREVIHKPRQ